MEHFHAGKFHALVARAADPGSEAARKLLTRVSNSEGCSADARRTGKLLGCNFRKVEKMRTIRRDGTPEIQEAVKNDKLRINSAYNKIRKMKQGQGDTAKNSSAAQIKPLKILFSGENFAIVKEWGEDVGTHVNKAVEMYIRWLQDGERPE